MDHRLFAVLAIICFALGGAGCASKFQIESREEVLMPLQTGSVIQRPVLVQKEAPTKKSKKKKKEKDEKKETKEPKPTSPKPTPAATPAATPESSPQAEPESTPERFR